MNHAGGLPSVVTEAVKGGVTAVPQWGHVHWGVPRPQGEYKSLSL
jgi:hypothetical protein